jgi:hypothetical protein
MGGQLKAECAQVLVLMLFAMTTMLGLAGMVIDVGAAYQADRKTQSAVDAAALACAQALPADTGLARNLAQQYESQNDPAISSGSITFSSFLRQNDTCDVIGKAQAPTYFLTLFGFRHIPVGSEARATAFVPGTAAPSLPYVVRAAVWGYGARTVAVRRLSGSPQNLVAGQSYAALDGAVRTEDVADLVGQQVTVPIADWMTATGAATVRGFATATLTGFTASNLTLDFESGLIPGEGADQLPAGAADYGARIVKLTR